MARNFVPSGGGTGGRLLALLVVVALVAVIIRSPSEAAGWVSGAASGIGDAIDGLATFFSSLGKNANS